MPAARSGPVDVHPAFIRRHVHLAVGDHRRAELAEAERVARDHVAVPEHLEELRTVRVAPELGGVEGEQEALDDVLVGIAVVVLPVGEPRERDGRPDDAGVRVRAVGGQREQAAGHPARVRGEGRRLLSALRLEGHLPGPVDGPGPEVLVLPPAEGHRAVVGAVPEHRRVVQVVGLVGRVGFLLVGDELVQGRLVGRVDAGPGEERVEDRRAFQLCQVGAAVGVVEVAEVVSHVVQVEDIEDPVLPGGEYQLELLEQQRGCRPEVLVLVFHPADVAGGLISVLVAERGEPVGDLELARRAPGRGRVLELDHALPEIRPIAAFPVARREEEEPGGVGARALTGLPDAASAAVRRGAEGGGLLQRARVEGEDPAVAVRLGLSELPAPRHERLARAARRTPERRQEQGAPLLLAVRQEPGVRAVGGRLARRERLGGPLDRPVGEVDRVEVVRGVAVRQTRIDGVAGRAVIQRPADGVERRRVRVDHRGAEDAPTVVDQPHVDFLGAPDRPAEGLGGLPQELAGIRVERPDVVAHRGDDGQVACPAVLQFYAGYDQGLGLEPPVVSGHVEAE